MNVKLNPEGVTLTLSLREYSAVYGAMKRHARFSVLGAEMFTLMPKVGSHYHCNACQATFPVEAVKTITLGKVRPQELEVCPICEGHDIQMIK